MKTLFMVTLVCLSLGQVATAQDRYYARYNSAPGSNTNTSQYNSIPPNYSSPENCPPGGGFGVKGIYAGSNWGAWRFCKVPGYGGYGGHSGYGNGGWGGPYFGNGGWGGAYYGGGYPGHHPCERCW